FPTHGVGIYIQNNDGSLPPWDPPGYKSSIVKDPAGTLLLVEQPAGGNIAGNDWPSFCMGPTGPSSGDQTPYQIASGGRSAWGAVAYGLHGKRFNYLFHDSHVDTLRIQQTVGSGTTNAPKGMWTLVVEIEPPALLLRQLQGNVFCVSRRGHHDHTGAALRSPSLIHLARFGIEPLRSVISLWHVQRNHRLA